MSSGIQDRHCRDRAVTLFASRSSSMSGKCSSSLSSPAAGQCSVEVGLEGAGQQQGAGQRARTGGQVGDGALAHIHVLHVDEARHVDWRGPGRGKGGNGGGISGSREGKAGQAGGQRAPAAWPMWAAAQTMPHPQPALSAHRKTQRNFKWREAQGLVPHLTAAAPAAARG